MIKELKNGDNLSQRRSPQEENGIITTLNMSREMHMQRRDEVFGCIPHWRGAHVAAGNENYGDNLLW